MELNRISAALTLVATTTLATACNNKQVIAHCPEITDVQQSTKSEAKGAAEQVRDLYDLDSLMYFIKTEDGRNSPGGRFEWRANGVEAGFFFGKEDIKMELTAPKMLDADFCADLAQKLFKIRNIQIPVKINTHDSMKMYMQEVISETQNFSFTKLLALISPRDLLLVYNDVVLLNTRAPEKRDEKIEESWMARNK